MRSPMRTAGRTVTAIAALLMAASPAAAGPPWISVEYPTNPHHPSTRDAAFLVRVYHHSTSITARVTGRAEGRVDGRRTSVPLTVEATATAGVYAIRGLPEGDGDWVAVIAMADQTATASVVVALGPDGSVVDVRVPSERSPDGWLIPRAVTDADIETGLRHAAAVASATRSLGDAPAGPAGASVPILLLIPAGIVAAAGVRRARTR